MGVKSYKKGKTKFWRVDTWVTFPNGTRKRLKKAGIPTREMAIALENKILVDGFEGRFFDRKQISAITVAEAWGNYKPVSKRKNKHGTYLRNISLANHILEHLGGECVEELGQAQLDAYRTRREGEMTQYGTPPEPSTLNREVALLKRVFSYAVKRRDIGNNPLSSVEMLEENNVRQVAINEDQFNRLFEEAEDNLRPILATAFETGMRRSEILNLKWDQVNLPAGTIRLSSNDTKSKKPRVIMLTDRVINELQRLPRSISGYVFTNPKTGNRWYDIKKTFDRARKEAKLEQVRFHDLRRSFITNARKRGIAESVVMKMSGHKTRSVFERYNVVDEEDLREAVGRIEDGRRKELAALEKVAEETASGASEDGGKK